MAFAAPFPISFYYGNGVEPKGSFSPFKTSGLKKIFTNFTLGYGDEIDIISIPNDGKYVFALLNHFYLNLRMEPTGSSGSRTSHVYVRDQDGNVVRPLYVFDLPYNGGTKTIGSIGLEPSNAAPMAVQLSPGHRLTFGVVGSRSEYSNPTFEAEISASCLAYKTN